MVIILRTNPRWVESVFIRRQRLLITEFTTVVSWIDLPNGQAQGRSSHLRLRQNCSHRSQSKASPLISLMYLNSILTTTVLSHRSEMRSTQPSERSIPFSQSSVNLNLAFPHSLAFISTTLRLLSLASTASSNSRRKPILLPAPLPSRSLPLLDATREAFTSFQSVSYRVEWGERRMFQLLCVLLCSNLSFRYLPFCRIEIRDFPLYSFLAACLLLLVDTSKTARVKKRTM